MKKIALIAAVAAMTVAGVVLAEATKAPTTGTPAATAPTTTTTAALTETTVKVKISGYDATNPTWANEFKTQLTGKGYKNVNVNATTGDVSFSTTEKVTDGCMTIKPYLKPNYNCTK